MTRTAAFTAAARDAAAATGRLAGQATSTAAGLARGRGKVLAASAGAAALLAGAGSGTAMAATTSPAAAAVSPGAGSDYAASPLAPVTAPAPAGHAAQAPARAATVPAQQAAPAQQAQQAQQAAPAQSGPYDMYDSVTPSSLPQGAAHVAAYTTGPYAASAAQMAGHGDVLWIDTNGSAPDRAAVLDVEPGDATPSSAATWAAHRLADPSHKVAVLYTMRSEWAATKAAVAAKVPASQQGKIRWWIADPTGVRHIVAGADATQWYWGKSIDISTAKASLTS